MPNQKAKTAGGPKAPRKHDPAWADNTRTERSRRQRARDAEAIQAWIDAGCPPPPREFRTVWSSKDKDAPTVINWIRKEYGKDETK